MEKTRTLQLTLKKLPFEVMVTGEKDVEIRQPSEWIISRLFTQNGEAPRKYDFIKFTNGYGADSPYFIARWTEKGSYGGFDLQEKGKLEYSNGLQIEWKEHRFIIYVGEIIEKGNLRESEPKDPHKFTTTKYNL